MLARIQKIPSSAEASFIYRRKADSRFRFNWHFHPEYELTWIQSGRGKRFVGDHIGDYRPGDLVLLGPNLPHTWCSEPDARPKKGAHRAVVVQFREDFLGDAFFARPELKGVRRLLDRSVQGLAFGGRAQAQATAKLEAMARRGGLARLVLLLDALENLASAGGRRVQVLSSRQFAPALRRHDEQRIDRVCRFINERFREDIAQPQAAAQVHLSVPAFSRFFKRATGKTFTDYVNELRVGWASRQLIETDRSVAEIAFAAGFNNLSNFNRRFLERKGLSPSRFRRQHAGSGA